MCWSISIMLIFIGFRFWLHLSDILKRATGSKPDAVLVWRMRCARMASKHVENDRYWRVVNVQEVGWYEVYKDHHVMTCIGNRVNLHLFLTILTMLRKS